MFNSPRLSLTPHGLVTNKRKHSQFIGSLHKLNIQENTYQYAKLIKFVSSICDNSSSNDSVGKILINNDIIISNQDIGILFIRDIKNIANLEVSELKLNNFMEISKYQYLIDSGISTNDTTDILTVSIDGQLNIINISTDGSIIYHSLKLQLLNEDEYITSLAHAGNVMLVGTSHEEIYVVRRSGRVLHADRLQQNRTIFSNLLQSGAKLIGISQYYHIVDSRITKMLPISMSFLLLTLGSQFLYLWADWANPGIEKLVWQINLRDMIKNDCFVSDKTMLLDANINNTVAINSTAKNIIKAFSMIDACLMPVEPGAEQAVLLVLSVGQTYVDNKLSYQLWLHTVELQISPVSSGIKKTAVITNRLLVADHVTHKAPDYKNILSSISTNDNEQSQNHSKALKYNCKVPMIHNLSPSWHVFITWTAAAAAKDMIVEESLGDTVDNTNNMLYCIQCDIRNQLPLSTSTNSSTNIPVEKVLDIKALTAFEKDGLCVVLKDGNVYNINPPLPRPSLKDYLPQYSKHKPVEHLTTTTTINDDIYKNLVSLFMIETNFNRLKENTSISSDLQNLLTITHDNMNTCHIVLSVVDVVSKKILNRAPNGELWGINSTTTNNTNNNTANNNSSSTDIQGSSNLLARYQMVHRLVHEKLMSHKRLIEILIEMGLYDNDNLIQKVLEEDHQQLLLCVGLANAVEEAQQRIRNTTVITSYPTTVTTCSSSTMDTFSTFHSITTNASSANVINASSNVSSTGGLLEALKYVSVGIEKTILQTGKHSIEGINSQGLSVADAFYSEPSLIFDGIANIIQCLVNTLPRSTTTTAAATATVAVGDTSSSMTYSQQQLHLQIIYNSISLVLSSFKYTYKGYGANNATVCANCNPKIRKSLIALNQLLLSTLKLSNIASSTTTTNLSVYQPIGNQYSNKPQQQQQQQQQQRVSSEDLLTKDKEGKRLTEFCSLVLESYQLEEKSYNLDTSNNIPLSNEWKKQYHIVKELTSDILLLTNHYREAFQLSCEHLYSKGLMEAWMKDMIMLRPKLEEMLRTYGTSYGTEDLPLATACYYWLEERKYYVEILSLGIMNKVLLEEFLETRPNLAWLHNLSNRDFSKCTINIVRAAEEKQEVSTYKALLSIAKLSAHLVNTDHPNLENDSKQEQTQLFHKATYDLNCNLALIRCQATLLELLPGVIKNPHNRISALDLIDIIINIITYYNPTNNTYNKEDIVLGSDVSVDEIRNLDDDDIIRLFHQALSILSIQFNNMDSTCFTIEQNINRKNDINNLIMFQTTNHHMNIEEKVSEKLLEEKNKLVEQLQSLWSSLLAVNTQLWLELVCYTSEDSFITSEESIETFVKKNCLLYNALLNIIPEAYNGILRKDLVPFDDQSDSKNILQKNDNISLLQQAIIESNISYKKLNLNGEIEVTNINQPRIEYVIKLSCSLALRDYNK